MCSTTVNLTLKVVLHNLHIPNAHWTQAHTHTHNTHDTDGQRGSYYHAANTQFREWIFYFIRKLTI